MYTYLTTLFLLMSFTLHAGIENYFKKAQNKSTNHSIRNIDFIYMLNLDQRPKKYQLAMKEFQPYDIYPYRFSAVNGWELSPTDLLEIGVKYETNMTPNLWATFYPLDGGAAQHEIMHIPGKTYFSHCMAKGAIGCSLSHCSILQDAYDSGYQTIWILEDDIEVIQNPHILSSLIDKLDQLVGKNNWDILFTDQDTKNNQGVNIPCRSFALLPNYTPANTRRFYNEKIISSDFKIVGSRYGAYSMVLRRSGIKKILDFIKTHQIFLPYDMTYSQPQTVKMYGLNYDLVSHKPNSISDNGSPPDRPSS